MCGIAGIYSFGPAGLAVERTELRRMRDQMRLRGPDGQGEWYAVDGRVGLGHRRLAIIDLSARASQPMVSGDGSLTIVFNGEIYNYQALRRRLEAQGCMFHSTSDTEVLLQLYAEKGAAMVHDLRGMFAFALWDARRHGLLLARDPYGIKPLYYATDGGTLRFASQVKALLAGGAAATASDPAGEAGFYLFGYVPEPFTLYRDVRALPAGCTLWTDNTGLGTPTAYTSIAAAFQREGEQVRLDAVERQERVRAALLDSVRQHMVADVPVGAFLSAGVDSGSLVGLMRDVGQDEIRTLTLGFGEFRGRPDDEAPLAQRVAAAYGTQHVTRTVTEAELRADLPLIFEAMDQPSIDGINTWFVSKAAREQGLKVAVSGLGGDELFGGYAAFGDIPRWVRWLSIPGRVPGLGRALRRLGGALFNVHRAPPSFHPKTLGLLEYGGTYAGAYLLRRALFMPWELPGVMGVERARVGLERLRPLDLIRAEMCPDPVTPFGRVAALEAGLYMRNQLLRDADWAGMAHSLEIRTPLVDITLLRELAPLSNQIAGHGKALLANSPSQPLIREVLDRPKTGFRTPIRDWLGRTPAGAAGWSGGEGQWSRHWARQVMHQP